MARMSLTVPLSLITVILLLAACGDRVEPTGGVTLANWQAIVPTKLVIADTMPPATTPPPPPTEANAALANEATLKRVLKYYRPNNTYPGNLGQLISAIRAADRPGLRGIGGVPGQVFLDAADAALISNNYNRQNRVTVELSGQILEYAFTKSAGVEAGNGRIVAATYIKRNRTNLNSGHSTTKLEAFKWEVVVNNDGFKIVGIGGDPLNNPFPGTLPFTPAMIQRVQEKGFTHKLWAKGTEIRIVNVWHKNNFNGSWGQAIPMHGHPLSGLYDRLAGNCIDMLFPYTPPPNLTALREPPFYCLGRCTRPLLVNTGY